MKRCGCSVHNRGTRSRSSFEANQTSNRCRHESKCNGPGVKYPTIHLSYRSNLKISWRRITDLNTLGAVDVEITAVDLGNTVIDNSSSWNVLRFSNAVVLVVAEETGAVEFVDADERQTGPKMISSALLDELS